MPVSRSFGNFSALTNAAGINAEDVLLITTPPAFNSAKTYTLSGD